MMLIRNNKSEERRHSLLNNISTYLYLGQILILRRYKYHQRGAYCDGDNDNMNVSSLKRILEIQNFVQNLPKIAEMADY